jgi:hypothetical protein
VNPVYSPDELAEMRSPRRDIAGFAGDRSGPFGRSPLAPPPMAGMRDPLDPGDMRPRPLLGERAPLFVEPYGTRPGFTGPRPYWENDPLFTAPAP